MTCLRAGRATSGSTMRTFSAWRRSGLPDPALDEWLTDRIARRPSGVRARSIYGSETIHDFARRAILDALRLGPPFAARWQIGATLGQPLR
jgi:hypothetical protein